jgi:hypothetical protein
MAYPLESASLNLADPLGVDISSYPGLDPMGTLVSGLTALAQRIARRLTTPRGAWFWAPNECTDVRGFLNDSIGNDNALAQIAAAIEREALREEAVAIATANVSFSQQTQTLTVHLTGTTRTAGPFNFVMAVTSVTLALLKAG